MDIQHVITLIDAVSNANIMNFQIEEGNFKLSMDKLTQRMEVSPTIALASAEKTLETPKMVSIEPINNGTQAPLSQVVVPQEVKIDNANIKIVESPIVGTFYCAAGPDTGNFVNVGDIVKEGQTLCIVEAMKLMNDIESDFAGEVVEILVQNEQMVEYGQALFKIKI